MLIFDNFSISNMGKKFGQNEGHAKNKIDPKQYVEKIHVQKDLLAIEVP